MSQNNCYEILPGLHRTLWQNCPSLVSAKERATITFQKSSFPELANKFILLPTIVILNPCLLDERKPVFTLSDINIVFCGDLIEKSDDESRQKILDACRLFDQVKDEMEHDGLMPVPIYCNYDFIIQRNSKNSTYIFGLTKEIVELRTKSQNNT